MRLGFAWFLFTRGRIRDARQWFRSLSHDQGHECRTNTTVSIAVGELHDLCPALYTSRLHVPSPHSKSVKVLLSGQVDAPMALGGPWRTTSLLRAGIRIETAHASADLDVFFCGARCVRPGDSRQRRFQVAAQAASVTTFADPGICAGWCRSRVQCSHAASARRVSTTPHIRNGVTCSTKSRLESGAASARDARAVRRVAAS